uniref:Uncharacterized protein n=1 Tax=Palpitomonas bilix TaxID=652834 RepID=A0A7S3DFK1_9EUKA|mmetsp:Transcript_35449/g.92293  ORF Transcript_35449/g.92293 Transcript_35449/m.92293 type:complete len:335 (+) Transcript_35449:556-1560(+)
MHTFLCCFSLSLPPSCSSSPPLSPPLSHLSHLSMSMMRAMMRTAAAPLLATLARSTLRTLSTTAPLLAERSAVVSDIDGVLLRGDRVIPGVPDAMKKLKDSDIPLIFITNGGGVPEDAKAEQLSKLLDYDVRPEDVILSHTPMRDLGKKHENDLVLVAGHRNEAEVAEAYGFKNFKLMEDYSRENPFLWFVDTKKHLAALNREGAHPSDFPPEPVKAIVVFTDPDSWGRDLQIMTDVLRSTGVPGEESSEQVVPIYCSNPDFVWMSEFSVPRFAQGAFTQCLRMLYRQATGRELEVTQYGKPMPGTYHYAESLLEKNDGKCGWKGSARRHLRHR